MSAYYNERDPFAAQWLRNLIAEGLIAPGHVDDRSIEEVRPDDLRGFTQCHFFAGIAGWSLALRLAGWDDARSVWTGSCPCQPFSAAGKGKAADDERHLWPCWFSLIRECKPPIVFGEQVEAAVGWGWLDLVFSDLEAEGYACGAAVLPACGVGAPHIRNRLWFVADAGSVDIAAGTLEGRPTVVAAKQGSAQHRGAGRMANAERERAGRDARNGACPQAQGRGEWREDGNDARDAAFTCGSIGELADADRPRQRAGRPGEEGRRRDAPRIEPSGLLAAGPLVNAPSEQMGLPGRSWLSRSADPWSDLEWLPCTDGKARPTQPGIFPLAHGVSARVGKLRAAGNAIVPQVAAEFIKATIS